jgi:hypothetical protein
LKTVDLPTFGSPTIPIFMGLIVSSSKQIEYAPVLRWYGRIHCEPRRIAKR